MARKEFFRKDERNRPDVGEPAGYMNYPEILPTANPILLARGPVEQGHSDSGVVPVGGATEEYSCGDAETFDDVAEGRFADGFFDPELESEKAAGLCLMDAYGRFWKLEEDGSISEVTAWPDDAVGTDDTVQEAPGAAILLSLMKGRRPDS